MSWAAVQTAMGTASPFPVDSRYAPAHREAPSPEEAATKD